jgi:hypothetical protein
MPTEMTVSEEAARATAALIHDYLSKGGTGLDADALTDMMDALIEADRIVIADEEEDDEG